MLRIINNNFLIYIRLNLQYDAVGNLVTGDGFYREYDGFNHLIRIRQGNTSNGQILEEFIWHPVEERILVKDMFSNGVKNYSIYYVNKNYIHIENSSGNYSEKYVYQDGVLVAQVTTDGQKHFIHNDHLNSITLITNASGDIIENSFHSPFGEITEGGKASRFGYTGKEFDSVTKDYDHNARRYNPNWGKFVQPDNNIPATYDPQSLNRYSYGMNNPYKFIDPNGREPVRSQAGNADQVIKYVKDIEKNNPDLSPNQVLDKMYEAYSANTYGQTEYSKKDNPNFLPIFIYTEEKGVIDMRHYFTNAHYVKVTGSTTLTAILATGVEIGQFLLGSESAFTYEDQLSNKLGREFGKNLAEDIELSKQLEELMKQYKSGKFPRWLWELMPDQWGEKYRFRYELLAPEKALPRSSHVSVGGGIELKPHCFVKTDPNGCRY